MLFFRTSRDSATIHHRNLVDSLVAMGAIRSRTLESAFRALPRHHFIDQYYDHEGQMRRVAPGNPTEEQLDQIYEDRAITTHVVEGQPLSSTSQPSLMATMIEELALGSGLRVLEIGAGTGWNAALMARVLGEEGRVVTVDVLPQAASEARRHLESVRIDNVRVVEGDGLLGFAEEAPFDRIVVTAGSRTIARAWRGQLREGGVLLANIQTRGAHCWSDLTRFRKVGGMLVGEILCPTSFIPIRGELAADTRTPPSEEEGAVSSHDPPWRSWLIPEGCRDRVLADLMLFLVLEGFTVEDQGRRFLIRHPHAFGHACAAFDDLELHGDEELLLFLGEATEKWIRLGAPRQGEWRVEMDGPATTKGNGNQWRVDLGGEELRFRLGK